MKKKDYGGLSLKAHLKTVGKMELKSKFILKNKDDLSIAYTPGVGTVSTLLGKNPSLASKYSLKGNTILVVSDGSAVLGLGNIGPYGAIPVMEGKSILMKNFANVDAFPICLGTQDFDEMVSTIKNIAPVFGGVNLEDISAPRCFELESVLRKELDIPVMHDDQWGAATVALAGLINATKVLKKNVNNLKCVVAGVGAAGMATILLIKKFAPEIKIYALDSKGVISKNRIDLSPEKVRLINDQVIEIDKDGQLVDVIMGTDIFIGLSKPGTLTQTMIEKMSPNPIVFGLANPIPEIMPEVALKAGVGIIGTGRSDYPNQINNSVFFPGFWRGMLDRKSKGIKDYNKYDLDLFVDCAVAISKSIKPTSKAILPSTLDKKVHKIVANAVLKYKFKS